MWELRYVLLWWWVSDHISTFASLPGTKVLLALILAIYVEKEKNNKTEKSQSLFHDYYVSKVWVLLFRYPQSKQQHLFCDIEIKGSLYLLSYLYWGAAEYIRRPWSCQEWVLLPCIITLWGKSYSGNSLVNCSKLFWSVPLSYEQTEVSKSKRELCALLVNVSFSFGQCMFFAALRTRMLCVWP